MRLRWGLVVVLVGALLSACAPRSNEPRPTGTLEPSITDSWVEPKKRPPNEACKLLTAKERSDLVGMSMDAEVPVRPANGIQECIWTHSLTEPARAVIRVTAINGSEWLVTSARSAITLAIARPGTSKSLARKLKAALREITNDPQDLSDERICEIHLLVTETRGMKRAEDMIFAGMTGSLMTVYAAACENGYIVMAGFGEHGLSVSIALSHGVFRLVESAIGRVDEVLGSSSGDETDKDAADGTVEGEEEETESPSPEPSESAEVTEDEEAPADES